MPSVRFQSFVPDLATGLWRDCVFLDVGLDPDASFEAAHLCPAMDRLEAVFQEQASKQKSFRVESIGGSYMSLERKGGTEGEKGGSAEEAALLVITKCQKTVAMVLRSPVCREENIT